MEQFKVTSMDLLNLAYSRSTELKHGKHSFAGIADKEYTEEFYEIRPQYQVLTKWEA